MKTRLCSLLFTALLSATPAFSQLITPVSVSGSGGLYAGNASLVIDGDVPDEGSIFFFPLAPETVAWSPLLGGFSTRFTVDLGSIFRINDILISVDNNDRYVVESSLDGLSFTNVFTIIAGHGEIGFGMDTFSTDSTSSEYIAALNFDPVDARYLRVRANGGDLAYSLGELQAFGVPVPEPSTYGAIAAAALLGLAAWRRRSRAA